MASTYDCGHGCKITCPDGGGCVYNHDTGACSTFCNDATGVLKLKSEGQPVKFDKAKLSTQKMDITLKNVTPAAFKKMLTEIGAL